MRYLLRALVFAVAAVLACSDATAPPRAGTLAIVLATPHPDDAAILLRVSGPTPVTEVVSATDSYLLHQRASDGVLRVAVFGRLANGALVTFTVPDLARAADYSATVIEVSNEANGLRADLSGYRLSVTR